MVPVPSLFIEIKKKGVAIFKKDGTLRSDQHLEQQNKVLIMLHRAGYKATFGVGLDQCIDIIDNYLAGRS